MCLKSNFLKEQEMLGIPSGNHDAPADSDFVLMTGNAGMCMKASGQTLKVVNNVAIEKNDLRTSITANTKFLLNIGDIQSWCEAIEHISMEIFVPIMELVLRKSYFWKILKNDNLYRVLNKGNWESIHSYIESNISTQLAELILGFIWPRSIDKDVPFNGNRQTSLSCAMNTDCKQYRNVNYKEKMISLVSNIIKGDEDMPNSYLTDKLTESKKYTLAVMAHALGQLGDEYDCDEESASTISMEQAIKERRSDILCPNCGRLKYPFIGERTRKASRCLCNVKIHDNNKYNNAVKDFYGTINLWLTHTPYTSNILNDCITTSKSPSLTQRIKSTTSVTHISNTMINSTCALSQIANTSQEKEKEKLIVNLDSICYLPKRRIKSSMNILTSTKLSKISFALSELAASFQEKMVIELDSSGWNRGKDWLKPWTSLKKRRINQELRVGTRGILSLWMKSKIITNDCDREVTNINNTECIYRLHTGVRWEMRRKLPVLPCLQADNLHKRSFGRKRRLCLYNADSSVPSVAFIKRQDQQFPPSIEGISFKMNNIFVTRTVNTRRETWKRRKKKE
jgi:hypothetical protein